MSANDPKRTFAACLPDCPAIGAVSQLASAESPRQAHYSLLLRRFACDELGFCQFREDPAHPHQFVEGTTLNDAALVEDEDAACIPHCRKSVRDDKGCAVLHHFIERGIHLGLSHGIKSTGGFI